MNRAAGRNARSAGRVGRRTPRRAARRHPPGAPPHHAVALPLQRRARCSSELKAAVDRGVAVEVLVTSRAKGGKKKMAKLWRALEADRRLAPRVHRSGREVSPQVSGRRRRAGDRGVAELHEEVLPEDVRRARHHPRSGGRLRPAPALDRRPRPPGDARGPRRPPDRRTGARAPAVHRADRRGAQQHPPDRREALGSRSRVAAEREARGRHDRRDVCRQAARRSEVARQDHADRRRDRRRRQPGAGGAQPRLPARGGHRRHRGGGGRGGDRAVPVRARRDGRRAARCRRRRARPLC